MVICVGIERRGWLGCEVIYVGFASTLGRASSPCSYPDPDPFVSALRLRSGFGLRCLASGFGLSIALHLPFSHFMEV
ncbi:hypothetical protein M758_UG263300 [Ceratodon purpureus]|nr:hypothetical protein M758_UG263300 [Ceratodon purpureus]